MKFLICNFAEFNFVFCKFSDSSDKLCWYIYQIIIFLFPMNKMFWENILSENYIQKWQLVDSDPNMTVDRFVLSLDLPH